MEDHPDLFPSYSILAASWSAFTGPIPGRYCLINYKNGLDTQARLLAALAPPLEDSDDIAHLVKEFSGLHELEIVVLNRQAHVIASSVDQSLVGQRLIQDEITKALTGQIDNTIRYDPVHRERRYYYAFPVKDERTTLGVIYLSGSLRQVDAFARNQGDPAHRRCRSPGDWYSAGDYFDRTITAPIRR